MQNNYTRIFNIRTHSNGTYKSSIKTNAFSFIGILLTILLVILVLQGITAVTTSWLTKIFLIPIILISLTVHEYAHARIAVFLGDPTPRLMGRLSLNPLKHLDPVGTLLLLFANFGWAKPVVVEPSNFRDPQKAMVSVALAGPISNMILAFIGMLSLKLVSISQSFLIENHYIQILNLLPLTSEIINTFIIINLGLTMFNLLPVPPLDGSRLLSYFMPLKYRYQYNQFEQMAPMILLFFMMFGGLSAILTPMVRASYSFLASFFF
ncbi:MAG: site-2 protease family protein [Candidatus Riflebacteria bacterium]|nr:site-2 protease family protein [Candidatus Riflebacteria bacterium]